MKINVFMLIVFYILLSSAAFSAEGEVNVQSVIKRMKVELQLSEEQERLLIPIIRKNLNKRQEVYDSFGSQAIFDKKGFKTRLMQLKEEENKSLSPVLTPEQFKRLRQKQHIKESLNKDQVDFTEGLTSDVGLSMQGGSLAF